MNGLKFIRWFFLLFCKPTKESTYTELEKEVARLRMLVDSLCARTNDLKEVGTDEWRAQMTLMGKSHMHGHRLIRQKSICMQLQELESKRMELTQDLPDLGAKNDCVH
jgi:hypothetical protein